MGLLDGLFGFDAPAKIWLSREWRGKKIEDRRVDRDRLEVREEGSCSYVEGSGAGPVS